jgi:hypothetical protein
MDEAACHYCFCPSDIKGLKEYKELKKIKNKVNCIYFRMRRVNKVAI